MRILAIDTSTESCSVALWKDDSVYSHFEVCPRGHAQRILSLIKDILKQGIITLSELDALAFSRGPGSFTGVRIGIGIAQGLALGAELPMIGISTLVTMAEGAWRNMGATHVLVAIDARMGEIYWAKYIRDNQGIWHGKESEALLKPEQVNYQLKQLSGEWVTVGIEKKVWLEMSSGCNILLQDSHLLFPVAEDMLPIACRLLEIGETISVEKAEPIYLW